MVLLLQQQNNLLGIVLMALLTGTSATDCPSNKCQCEIAEVASRPELHALCNAEDLGYVPVFREFVTPISVLWLNNIRLTELGNNTFTHLTAVKSIHLNDNLLNRIDPAAFKSIDTMLEVLDMQHNLLTDVNFLGTHNFTNLRRLLLRDNRIFSISTDSFSRLSSLDSINLDDNGLTENLNFLRQPSLKALTLLNLDANQIDKINPEDFQHLTNLQVLLLNSNRLKNAEFLAHESFSRLTGLSLGSNDIVEVNSGLFENKPLRWIDLSDNQITDVSFLTSCSLTRLEEIYLNKNKLESIPQQAFQATRNLAIFNVDDNKLTSLSGCALSRFFKRMEIFSIKNNPIICDCSIAWLQQQHDTMTENVAQCTNLEFRATNNFDTSQCKPEAQCTRLDSCTRTNNLMYYSSASSASEDSVKDVGNHNNASNLSSILTQLLFILHCGSILSHTLY